MSVTLNNITGSDTFDTWRTRTNDIIAVSAKSVTMSGDANVGNILLTGNFTFQSDLNVLKITNIEKTSGGSALKLNSDTKVSGLFTVDAGTNPAAIVIGRDGNDKWKIKTNASHSKLIIEDVVLSKSLEIENGIIDTVGLELSEGVLPTTLTRRIAHTGTGASGSSFADVDISAGIISPTRLTATGTSANKSVFAEVDIADGEIDGTTIGTTSASTGKFTTLEASSHVTAPHFRGDLAQSDGTIILDVSSASFAGEANSVSANAISQVLDKIYSVGSLYLHTTNSNPYDILGVGASASSWIPYCEGASPIGYQHWNLISASRGYGNFSEIYVTGLDGDGVKESDKLKVHDVISVTGFVNYNGDYAVTSKSGDWVRISRPAGANHNEVSSGSRKLKNKYAKTLGAYDGQQGLTLSEGQMPRHRHQLGIPRDSNGTNSDQYALYSTPNSDENTLFEHYSDYQGNSERVNIQGKVQTIYIWKRIS